MRRARRTRSWVDPWGSRRRPRPGGDFCAGSAISRLCGVPVAAARSTLGGVMSRVIHVFRQPERFVAGTVGEPGDRSFYLQAIEDARTVSVLLEKQQVSVLAERITALLQEVARRFGSEVPTGAGDPDADPLAVPLEEEFRVGTIGLGWDADSRSVVVELLAVTEEEVDESVVLDDTEEGPDAL